MCVFVDKVYHAVLCKIHKRNDAYILQLEFFVIWKIVQEIVSGGGKTVWGDPAEVGKVVGGAAFDVVLDNNGKDLDTVRFVALVLDT